jgi:hypothetical protein
MDEIIVTSESRVDEINDSMIPEMNDGHNGPLTAPRYSLHLAWSPNFASSRNE